MPDIAILGAGMLGTCLALEMAHRGIRVDLYDRSHECVTQAGQRNEGKIHLGFVYGADFSGKTADKMVQGALSFYPLLKRWIGSELDSISISTPFIYAVACDSLLSPAVCEEHFTQIEKKLVRCNRLNYPGGLSPAVEKLPEAECHRIFNRQKIQAAYRTCERAIDVRMLAHILQKKVRSSSLISFFPNSAIQTIQERNSRWKIQYTTDIQTVEREYDIVINALWDGRIAIDHQAGLFQKPPWSYRLKYALFLECGDSLDLPSTTLIQGPYGDLVNFGQGRYYLSWYPQCMQGFVKNTIAPPPWKYDLSESEAKELIANAVAGLAQYIPLVAQLNEHTIQEYSVLGGVIYAAGDTDVQDPQSGLHQRHELDIKKNNTYYSINPGKYSTCPAFAYKAADQISAECLLSATPV